MACEDEFGIEIDPESNPKTVGESSWSSSRRPLEQ